MEHSGNTLRAVGRAQSDGDPLVSDKSSMITCPFSACLYFWHKWGQRSGANKSGGWWPSVKGRSSLLSGRVAACCSWWRREWRESGGAGVGEEEAGRKAESGNVVEILCQNIGPGVKPFFFSVFWRYWGEICLTTIMRSALYGFAKLCSDVFKGCKNTYMPNREYLNPTIPSSSNKDILKTIFSNNSKIMLWIYYCHVGHTSLFFWLSSHFPWFQSLWSTWSSVTGQTDWTRQSWVSQWIGQLRPPESPTELRLFHCRSKRQR